MWPYSEITGLEELTIRLEAKIAELEKELSALRTNYIGMVERCGGQSHLITRLIEAKVPLEPDLIESCRQHVLALEKMR